MNGVTKEQIAAAKRMTAIEFLRRYRPNDLVKSSARGEFELRSHDSFKINGESSVWHWKSRGIGGKSALDYLIYVEGVRFVDAVRLLCEESPAYTEPAHESIERERPPFALPAAAPNNDRIVQYIPTTKPEPELHGFGLPNVMDILHKYGVFYLMDYKDGSFLFCLEWPDTAKQKAVVTVQNK